MIEEEKRKWSKGGGQELLYAFEGIGSDSIVFDIGLYKGGWSERITRKYDPYIYGFEPVSEFYQDAQKALAKHPKVKVLNFGLGKNTRQATIYIKGDAASLMEGKGRRAEVEIKSIKEFMSEFNIDFVDLAAINIEGGEYELLDFMISAGLMPKFGMLLIQFHEAGTGHRYKREVIRTMLKLTHKEVYCYETVWELWEKRK